MNNQRAGIGLVLAIVALWLGGSLAALLTGVRTDPAIVPAVSFAIGLIAIVSMLGYRARGVDETTYW